LFITVSDHFYTGIRYSYFIKKKERKKKEKKEKRKKEGQFGKRVLMDEDLGRYAQVGVLWT
jgi:hypothetical protein